MYELTQADLSRLSIDALIATNKEIKASGGDYKRIGGVHGPVRVTKTAIRAEIMRRSTEMEALL